MDSGDRGDSARALLEFLGSTTLFGGLDPSEVKHLLRLCKRRRTKAFEYVFRQGDFEESLYFIYEGSVYLTLTVGEEEEFLTNLERGETFGEAGLLRGGIRTASVRARTDCLLLILEKGDLDGIKPPLLAKLMRNVAITSLEKLSIANQLINKLYGQLQSQPRAAGATPEELEDDFVEGFDAPQV